jgi:hypothetical protein
MDMIYIISKLNTLEVIDSKKIKVLLEPCPK